MIGNVVIELLVIRGIACGASFSDYFFEWLVDVIGQACADRRDVRVSNIHCVSLYALIYEL